MAAKKRKKVVKKKTVKRRPVKTQKVMKKPSPKVTKEKKPDQGIVIAGMIINIILLPGLGTIIAGRNNPGIAQMVIFLAGIPLSLLIIGIPMMLAAWIWALVTSIEMAQSISK